jgi:Terminase-like family.
MTEITYIAPPTCARFMKSDKFGRLIAGPVGSGKTTACIFELFRRACEQEPAPDGLRYTRFAIVRQTLKQLKDTVLKDITAWLKGMGTFKVSENTIFVTIGDVRSEWLLIPLDTPEDQRRLLSMQLTGAWLSECIEMDVGLISPLAGRVGRYPSAAMGGATWFGMIADTNMPSEGSPWHTFMELNTPEDWEIFIQPGGMDVDAENLEWLTQTPETLKLPPDDPRRRAQGRTYYERFIRSNSADWCKRYVHAQYGDDPSGTAVFRESFKMSFHVAQEGLEPIPNRPLLIGQDFGRDPWSIICQLDHLGRLLVLEEVPAEDVGLEMHIERSLRPALMDPRYMGLPIAVIGDPSGVAKSSIYEETCFDALKRLGFSAFPAPTNDLEPRLMAVEAFLLGQRDGGPAIVFDGARCKTLVRGMSGGYRYGKTKSGQRKPTPEKNQYSHPCDSLQYACLAARGEMTEMIARKLTRRTKRPRNQVSAMAWT